MIWKEIKTFWNSRGILNIKIVLLKQEVVVMGVGTWGTEGWYLLCAEVTLIGIYGPVNAEEVVIGLK